MSNAKTRLQCIAMTSDLLYALGETGMAGMSDNDHVPVKLFKSLLTNLKKISEIAKKGDTPRESVQSIGAAADIISNIGPMVNYIRDEQGQEALSPLIAMVGEWKGLIESKKQLHEHGFGT